MLEGPTRYGVTLVDEQQIQQLKQLSTQAGCWIVFDEIIEEKAVPIIEWNELYRLADLDKFRFYKAELNNS